MRTDPLDLIRNGKKIMGFQLGNWLNTKGILFKMKFVSQVKKNLASQLSSHVNREYPISKVDEALSYYREHMSEGKIILKPTMKI